MKSFFEKLKDLLYDGVDYIMMIIVVVVVALIINWRLNGLFAKDAIDLPSNNSSQITNESKPDDNNKLNENLENPVEDENIKNPDEENLDSLIQITIPGGSLPSKVGEILVNNYLIEDENEFIQKAIELKLDTKLKSGNFEIPKNSSIEDILNIITK